MIAAQHMVYGHNGNLGGEPFILRIKTDNAGTSASNQFTLLLQNVVGLTYDYFVDWGDGEFTSHNTNANVTHTFPTAGEYIIRIYGKFEKIYFNNGGDKAKLLDVLQWGDSYGNFPNQSNAFFGCSNLRTVPNGNVFGNVTNMSAMFANCTQFNSDISLWNVGNVTNMSFIFSGCTQFNSDISLWNVGNVTNMQDMIYNCTQFNSDISLWNVGNVTNMTGMFYSSINFTHNLQNWDVRKVLNFNSFMSNGLFSNSTDISFWNFNKNVTFAFFINYKSGFELTPQQFDGWLQKVVTAVIGTGRTQSNKTIGITPLRVTAAGKAHYDALVADGWTFTYGVTVV